MESHRAIHSHDSVLRTAVLQKGIHNHKDINDTQVNIARRAVRTLLADTLARNAQSVRHTSTHFAHVCSLVLLCNRMSRKTKTSIKREVFV